MAPITRSMRPQTPPPHRSRGKQADTIKKSRFYEAWDNYQSSESIHVICITTDTTSPTARRWIHQRDLLGSKGYRRTRKLSDRLGRTSRVSNETCKMLVSPSRNPVRNEPYEVQIEHYGLPIKKRQLQNRLKQLTNGAQRYKQAYVRKRISQTNKEKRVKYGEEHQFKTIHNH
jgi:hypothetical protein